jgi:5-methyltetrahydrofolate--homocysteine methyltransferase
MSDLNALNLAVEKGNRIETQRFVREALEGAVPPRQILDAMVSAMDVVGAKFQRGEAFVPEMLIAARAMKEGMALLEPALVKAGIAPKLKAVIGTVQGDLHDIGKNLVAMMWKGANFAVTDLGTNVPSAKFIAAARENGASVIGLSALLTTTLPAMRDTVAQIRSADLPGVKVVVGGAPVTGPFAQEIGADGFAADAVGAVEIVRSLCGVGV